VIRPPRQLLEPAERARAAGPLAALSTVLAVFGFRTTLTGGYLQVHPRAFDWSRFLVHPLPDEAAGLRARLGAVGLESLATLLLRGGVTSEMLAPIAPSPQELWRRLITLPDQARHVRCGGVGLRQMVDGAEIVPASLIDPELAGLVIALNRAGVRTHFACVSPRGRSPRISVEDRAAAAGVLRAAGLMGAVIVSARPRGGNIILRVPPDVPVATLAYGMIARLLNSSHG